jgi:glycosyltransferase involved in cell wall biosynthesis
MVPDPTKIAVRTVGRRPGSPERKILFLTKYGRRAATTRYRVLQYVPFLEGVGLMCEVRPLLSDRYLSSTLDEGRSNRLEALKGILRRLDSWKDVRQFGLVVIHMEALPYLPGFFERALGRTNIPYVYDFDDASFHQYDQSRWSLVRQLFSRKIARIIEGAALVTAGNEYLADYARRFNAHVVVVPTVVDVNRFLPRLEQRERKTVVVGWMGSRSTAAYLIERQSIWRAITADGRCTLRVIGSGPLMLSGAGAEVRRWSERTEIDDVRDFDIGIMPLRDDPWSRGKCGFKLIEYMACGLPVVASPVGVNSTIVKHGKTGFLCGSDEEWIARLRQLAYDPSLRTRMGEMGRRDVTESWSLQRWAPELARLLDRAAEPST